MIVNNESKSVWKRTAVARFKVLSLGDIEKFVKTSVKIFGVLAEIRTENPAIISHKYYHLFSLLWVRAIQISR
jgi:hypothetical protein